eukprot:364316-Chlamydomonas_euryale.AAC.10
MEPGQTVPSEAAPGAARAHNGPPPRIPGATHLASPCPLQPLSKPPFPRKQRRTVALTRAPPPSAGEEGHLSQVPASAQRVGATLRVRPSAGNARAAHRASQLPVATSATACAAVAMAEAPLSTSSLCNALKAQLKEVLAQRDAMEADAAAITARLNAPGMPGLKGGLLDKEVRRGRLRESACIHHASMCMLFGHAHAMRPCACCGGVHAPCVHAHAAAACTRHASMRMLRGCTRAMRPCACCGDAHVCVLCMHA